MKSEHSKEKKTLTPYHLKVSLLLSPPSSTAQTMFILFFGDRSTCHHQALDNFPPWGLGSPLCGLLTNTW
uniref:Uncharacterized protein n=1 Tax=Nelumbo nucifera TaxID=4432 RepID=A0A822Z6W0_NELNU|nr:TPA_asm: hypothetical protein HUJ06_013507 [Nelumbo nucifera]